MAAAAKAAAVTEAPAGGAATAGGGKKQGSGSGGGAKKGAAEQLRGANDFDNRISTLFIVTGCKAVKKYVQNYLRTHDWSEKVCKVEFIDIVPSGFKTSENFPREAEILYKLQEMNRVSKHFVLLTPNTLIEDPSDLLGALDFHRKTRFNMPGADADIELGVTKLVSKKGMNVLNFEDSSGVPGNVSALDKLEVMTLALNQTDVGLLGSGST